MTAKKPRPTLRSERLKMLKRTREAQRKHSKPETFNSLISWLEKKVKPKQGKGK